MNQLCDPRKSGCGTLFTVGAERCPNCQKSARRVGRLNVDGATHAELVGVSAPAVVNVELPDGDETSDTTDE